MSSLNSSLNLGQRALSINQRAMQTVGHNIANQGTEGFSRQHVRSGTSAPDPTGVGGGADAQPTTQGYDKFVQRKILQENPRSGMFKSRGEFLQKIEIIFSIKITLKKSWDQAKDMKYKKYALKNIYTIFRIVDDYCTLLRDSTLKFSVFFFKSMFSRLFRVRKNTSSDIYSSRSVHFRGLLIEFLRLGGTKIKFSLCV